MNKNKKSVLKSKNTELGLVPKSENVLKENTKAEKMKKKSDDKKKSKDKNSLEKKDPDTKLSEAEIKKIEKKKAKKLAQKLKRAQRKAEGIENSKKPNENDKKKGEKQAKKRKIDGDGGAGNPKEDPVPTKKQKKNKKQKNDQDKLQGEESAKSKGVPNASDANDTKEPVGERVLLKKEKKLKKRQQLKEQKLAEKATRDPAEDEATVFVGNVPVNTKRVQLIRLFHKYGPVNCIRLRSASGKILHKHKMRKAAGSLNAYVVLTSKAAAEKALELNGTEFKGNHLRVTKSSMKNTPELNDEAKRTIFVGNLKYTANEELLRETFSSCGEVEYVRCIRDGEKGCKGVAYVRFKSSDAVGLALELNQTILDERPINVERYSIKKLGAKEKRDASAANEKKNNAKPKGKGDKLKKPKNPKSNVKANTTNNDTDETKKSKKSEFRGVKVEALKKKLKMKKKKSSKASEIAKKIAPRTKTEE